jgi:hypothetical protein
LEQDGGKFSSKHPSWRKEKPEVAARVSARAKGGELPCAVAFQVAEELGVEPEEVGFTADRLGLRLTKCQLGLYGYSGGGKLVEPAESVSEELESAIKGRLENGKLPCEKAWEVASLLRLRKLAVARACEALGIKISACQLGSFK